MPDSGISLFPPAGVLVQGVPMRNVVRNGDMSIAQRGNGPVASGPYFIDGWLLSANGGSATQARVGTQASGGLAVDGAGWALTCALTGQAAAGDYAVLVHRIEGVRTLAGKLVTLSFLASASAGTPKIGVEVEQVFGTGGSANVPAATGQITLSTTPTRYSITFTVLSIAGKTIGTAGDHLSLNLWLSSGATLASRASFIGIQNNTFSITDVQLEAGANP